ncbi:hypothetical protein, partial [Mycoplasma sp. HS2188]|uniref:hypothetical protein n=1 Tax=Mycoplasma sp. HS2188 TaxID=2976765 RepID=UPI0021AAF9E3
EKYNNAAAAMQAILIKGAKDRFDALKSETNKIINSPVKDFDSITSHLQNTETDLSDKVAKSNELAKIEEFYNQLKAANDLANKQKEFANKYNEIVDLASNDKYSDIKDAIKELMKPLKDDVENSNDTDFIGQKTEQLTTDNYAQKVEEAIAKHNEVDSKINELNNAKNTEYANYPEAKQILQNAVDKYNNSTLNSDDIDPQISDKNVLNPQNYTNIINK